MEVLLLHPAVPADVPANTAALGCFDGVHRGHRLLLDETVRLAAGNGTVPAVFTFAGELPGVKPGAQLTSAEERLSLFEAAGIRLVLETPFPEISGESPEAFVRDFLRGLCRTETAVCGFNFRFGAGAAGRGRDLRSLMRRWGGDARILPPFLYGDEPVSATRIRRALAVGLPEAAADMLGRPYGLTAPVEHGKALGRTWGLPTLNQRFPAGAVLPRRGVYACRCLAEGRWLSGVCNVGVRPTVESGSSANCETHLLDFRGDLYGQTVRTELLSFLRPEIRFSTPEDLRAQILRDAEAAEAFFRRREEGDHA